MGNEEAEIGTRGNLYPDRFLESLPFHHAKTAAKRYNCDVAIPNGPGIGDVVCFTRLLEEMALIKGRPLRVLTGGLALMHGPHPNDGCHPLLEQNPFVSEIVDFLPEDESVAKALILEKDNCPQFGHIIENICRAYGLRPRKAIGSLFLSEEEIRQAFDVLHPLRRPLVCLHPAGKSSSLTTSPWYRSRWLELIAALAEHYGVFQIGRQDIDKKIFDIPTFDTNIRQAMALIRSANVFLGFDSGLGHMASALEVPSVILWDAPLKSKLEDLKEPGFAFAALMRWSYPQNSNILLFSKRDEEKVRDIVHSVHAAANFGASFYGKP